MAVALDERDREQVARIVAALRDVLGTGLIGAYLHGSAVLGGLRARSDIDVLAVAARRLTHTEKRRLIARLLVLSGRHAEAGPARPVELTVVVGSEIRPWRYPPTMDFQYGEWWRESFARGELEPWGSRTNRDLSPLVTMALLGEATLAGPPPSDVFDPVPGEDLIDALVAGTTALVEEIDSDTRNVVLTLARIWSGVVTGAVHSKDTAADWALPRLPVEHRAVLTRARDGYLGTEDEGWDDIRGRIGPFAEAIVAEIEAAGSATHVRVTPTAYSDLNALLEELVASVRVILSDNFCGAYLQGSFAVGDADVHSDVDFIVVTHEDVGDAQVAVLQAMHKRIYELDVEWAQHLEGSYVPKERLRHLDPDRSPYLYLDNGAAELVRDNHCNTAVVRWSLRELGVVLAGPDPQTLVDPITAEQLQSEALNGLSELVAWAPTPTKAGGMSRWLQPYLVLSACRMLHTLDGGRVSSKREAGEWALRALDPNWTDLVRRALDDRPDPWLRVYQPADAEIVRRTLAFVDYALARGHGRMPA